MRSVNLNDSSPLLLKWVDTFTLNVVLNLTFSLIESRTMNLRLSIDICNLDVDTYAASY